MELGKKFLLGAVATTALATQTVPAHATTAVINSGDELSFILNSTAIDFTPQNEGTATAYSTDVLTFPGRIIFDLTTAANSITLTRVLGSGFPEAGSASSKLSLDIQDLTNPFTNVALAESTQHVVFLAGDEPSVFNASTNTISLELQGLEFLASPNGSVTLGLSTVTPSVPEPATWAMMLAGFALVGAGVRRAKQNQTGSYTGFSPAAAPV